MGFVIETPLLVPSFSSKGFAFNPDGTSETVKALETSSEFIAESLLLSAYDIYHKHIPIEDDVSAEITLIDSGGYETGKIYDLSATTQYEVLVKEWNRELHIETLSRWPNHKAAVIVSFDHADERKELIEQINDANMLFSKFPNSLGNFLIKPETKAQTLVQIDNIISRITDLAGFSMIGITEKELGKSLLQRMKNIARIREELNSISSPAAIHVFGSLDPVTSILYFLAGAEVFDGLTWLKYSYHESSAIYSANYGVYGKNMGIHTSDSQVRYMSMTNNVYYLNNMKYAMKDYVKYGNFKIFDQLGRIGFGEILKKCLETSQT